MTDKETKVEREEREAHEEEARVQNDRINQPGTIRPTQGIQIIDPVTGQADGYRPMTAQYVPNPQPGYVDVPPAMRTVGMTPDEAEAATVNDAAVEADLAARAEDEAVAATKTAKAEEKAAHERAAETAATAKADAKADAKHDDKSSKKD